MSTLMYYPKSCNSESTNDAIRTAVQAEQHAGTNWMGATATLAVWLSVSPDTIRKRCRDLVIGPSRTKTNLVDGCWAFLDAVEARQRAWVDRLAADNERRRKQQQEAEVYGTSDLRADPRRLARDEADVAAARRALGEYGAVRVKQNKGR